MVAGGPVDRAEAIAEAARLLGGAKKAVALVSSWGSNEELAAFQQTIAASLGARLTSWVKSDHQPMPGEVVEDDILIKADKNPNRRGALALFPGLPDNGLAAIPSDADVVLVWGEGVPATSLPAGAQVIRLDSYASDDNATARVFLPISVQTERAGHYTNFEGKISAFAQSFSAAPTVSDAEVLFGMLVSAEARSGARQKVSA